MSTLAVSGFTFRDYVEEDRTWVLEAMVESAQATLNPKRAPEPSAESLRKTVQEDFARFHDRAKKPQAMIVAQDEDGRRAGFIWITMDMPVREAEDNAWLLEVYVAPGRRGQGLSKVLMSQAEAWARDHGVREIWLNVGSGNLKALRLYESLGFQPETVHLFKTLDR